MSNDLFEELGPMGQVFMSGVRAIKEKKKSDEESQGLLSGQLSNVGGFIYKLLFPIPIPIK